jgi:hypothetical protein
VAPNIFSAIEQYILHIARGLDDSEVPDRPPVPQLHLETQVSNCTMKTEVSPLTSDDTEHGNISFRTVDFCPWEFENVVCCILLKKLIAIILENFHVRSLENKFALIYKFSIRYF